MIGRHGTRVNSWDFSTTANLPLDRCTVPVNLNAEHHCICCCGIKIQLFRVFREQNFTIFQFMSHSSEPFIK